MDGEKQTNRAHRTAKAPKAQPAKGQNPKVSETETVNWPQTAHLIAHARHSHQHHSGVQRKTPGGM